MIFLVKIFSFNRENYNLYKNLFIKYFDTTKLNFITIQIILFIPYKLY